MRTQPGKEHGTVLLTAGCCVSCPVNGFWKSHPPTVAGGSIGHRRGGGGRRVGGRAGLQHAQSWSQSTAGLPPAARARPGYCARSRACSLYFLSRWGRAGQCSGRSRLIDGSDDSCMRWCRGLHHHLRIAGVVCSSERSVCLCSLTGRVKANRDSLGVPGPGRCRACRRQARSSQASRSMWHAMADGHGMPFPCHGWDGMAWHSMAWQGIYSMGHHASRVESPDSPLSSHTSTWAH